MTRLFRIGARGSALSLAQSRGFVAAFGEALGIPSADRDHRLPFHTFTTTGDRITDRRLIEAGGKGLFTKELDEALLDGRIDFAVHSLKDVPTHLPDGIVLACVPRREDPRDAFVSAKAATLDDLPSGAIVGTASLRRQAQVLHRRPDLRVETLRGNVGTRLDKVESGAVDATFLAAAGLRRLGLEDRAASLCDPQIMPPAAAQGALAITARADDDETRALLSRLACPAATIETAAERAFLMALDGSCRTSIAALARSTDAGLSFLGEALTPDGRSRWRRTAKLSAEESTLDAAIALGARLGAEIRDEAGDALLRD
jgi:hydroxymethylbilane synthase